MHDSTAAELQNSLNRIEGLLERIAVALEAKQPSPPKRKSTDVGSPKVGPVWDSYAAMYQRRYGVEPVRNAKTNALCVKLVDRLGADAAEVAAFYVRMHADRLYLSSRHALDLLLRDAEKIRTDWKRGCAGTQKQAQNEESMAVARDQLDRIAKGTL